MKRKKAYWNKWFCVGKDKFSLEQFVEMYEVWWQKGAHKECVEDEVCDNGCYDVTTFVVV